MLHLSYANHMEALIEPLLERIKARQEEDPFRPISLIVPNPSIAHFVRFQVAQRLGVSAHLEFHYLRRFLMERVQEADEKIRILEGESLQLLIFKHLNRPETLQHITLEPVRTYLDIAESPEEREGRSIQLAGQLARLFEEYGYARQEMLAHWREGKSTLKTGSWARAERWQRTLWRGLFDDEGAIRFEAEEEERPQSTSKRRTRSRRVTAQPALFYQDDRPTKSSRKTKKNQPRWMFLPEAVRATQERMTLPDQIYVFGLSYVAFAFARIFSSLSAYADIMIYALNPCCEFWEDVDHRLDVAREGWRSRKDRVEDFQNQEDPFNLEDPNDTPALRLWGRPGREYIRTLNQLTDCEFDPYFIDPLAPYEEAGLPAPLLKSLQQDILYRTPARPPLIEDHPPDPSVRLIACPGVRREVEVIADEIWRFMSEAERKGQPLRFHQIAVMVTDYQRQDYLTHIDSIFRERYQIPFNMIDRQLSAQSRVLEGILRLLELPLGDFGYLQVIGVATHPVIGGALEGINLDRWRRWGEHLKIRFGADQSALENTYVDRDVYHWDQGLKRLLLGIFMEGESSGDERIFEVDERAWVPFDAGGDRLHDAGQMIHLCRCLLLDATRAKRERLSLGEWCMFFIRLLNRYIGAKSPADEQALSRCLETIEELRETDLEGAKISYEVAQTLLKGRLKQLDSRRGQHQADGVVVSSMLPMRAVPFHTIFLMGMGEKDFPAKTPQDPLDLRQAQLHPGDVSPSQRDRYLFLETLLCARERLVISYVAFDDRTGDPLEPSAVIRELHFISRGYLGPSGLKAERHPLSAYDLSYDWALPYPISSSETAQFETLWASPFSCQPTLRREDHHREDQPELIMKDLKREISTAPLSGEDSSLRGWLIGPAGRPFTAPEVLKGIRAARLRGALSDFIGVKMIPREELSSAIKLWSRESLNTYLGIEAPPTLERGEGARTRLSLSAIRGFLLSPLQGSARAMLRLEDDYIIDEEAPLHDPLHFHPFDRNDLLSRAFWEGDGLRAEVGQLYDLLFERASLKGQAPVGIFADEQRRRDHRALNTWIQNIHAFQLPQLTHWKHISVGEAREFELLDERLPPLRITAPLPQGGEVTVELTGRLSPLQPDYGATLHCTPRESVAESLFLTGFLEMVFLAAMKRPLKRTFDVYLSPLGEQQVSKLKRTYKTPTPAQARDWLSLIVAEMLQGFHAYRLPIKAVLKWREHLIRDSMAPFRVRYEDNPRGPIPTPERFPIPPQMVALNMVEQRLGPWFHSEVML